MYRTIYKFRKESVFLGSSDIKHILACLRRADEKFSLIASGDRICVGISGGKDSLMLLFALSIYKKFSKKDFSLFACTVSLGLEPFDTSKIAEFCKSLNVEYKVVSTDIYDVVFNVRKEKNPCSLCANMRRGALNEAASKAGCNKVALAHHRDDAIETLIMSLFFEGRMNTLAPKTYLSRADITVIRPFVLVPEEMIASSAAYNALPVLKNPCPADGVTKRTEIKDLINTLNKTYPDLHEHLLHALESTETYNLWDKYIIGENRND